MSRLASRRAAGRSPRRAQRGVVLFIALIILVAMSLAGVALIRGADTGTVIAGNLAFRQNTTHVADLGVEAARAWLYAAASPSLQNDQPGTGTAYFATWASTIDILGNDVNPLTTPFDWSTAVSVTTGAFAPPAGYSVQYVIHRLCSLSGDPTGSSTGCIKSVGDASTGASGTKGAATYGGYAIAISASALYRVTVRVAGPRNAVSFVQTTVY